MALLKYKRHFGYLPLDGMFSNRERKIWSLCTMCFSWLCG